MQFGTMLVWFCLATTMVAVGAYVSSAHEKSSLTMARASYCLMTVGTLAASICLMALILDNRFDIRYVSAYSSTDLALVYKISAFWAGQEGSFLLWTVFGAVIGLFLAAKAKDSEPWLMAFWCAVQTCLFTLLLMKNPFGPTPEDILSKFPHGQGLNPLLQNFWMAIHPPLVFLGYAAVAAPAAFAVAALIRREYDTWSNRCLPWALFAWITLGAGIIIGGYWAYEVLGWGGYWSWDPVENASLVPWLASTALFHGMLLERRTGSMRRMNIVVALLSFLLALYATYLTRSGVLGDFSEHSFEATNAASNTYLVGFLLFFTALSLGLLLWRQREIHSLPWYSGLMTRESAFFAGIVSLSALALLVLVGTSSPLITKAFGSRPANVDLGYYGIVSSPVAVILLVILSLTPLLKWTALTRDENKRAAASTVVATVLGLVLATAAAVAMTAGTVIAVSFAVGVLAAVAVIVNGWFALIHGRRSWKALGGHLAHFGVALIFMGIVFCPSSARPKESAKIVLPQGEVLRKMGYEFTYLGAEALPDRTVARVKVERNGSRFIARFTQRPTDTGVIHTPYIHRTLTQDMYIAPQKITTLQIEPMFKPAPSGTAYTDAFTPDGGLAIRLMGAKNDPRSGVATLAVQKRGERPVLLRLNRGESKRFRDYRLTLTKFQVYGRQDVQGDMSVGAVLAVDYPGAKPSAEVEISIKHFVSLIWIGSILVLMGGVMAVIRRSGDNRKQAQSTADKRRAEARRRIHKTPRQKKTTP